MRSFHQPLLLTILALALVCGAMEIHATSPSADTARISEDFETALDLWRNGRYVELYDRTYAVGTGSREAFISRMAGSSRKPACCWQKLQDLKIGAVHGNSANVSARVGLECLSGETDYCTRAFRLKKEDGTWKISMADILSLAGRSGRKRIRGR